MHPTQLLLLLLLLLVPLVSCQLNFEDLRDETADSLALFGIPKKLWRCGTEGFIADQSILRVNETCPLAAAEFNHCCAIHDDCYNNQRGQSACDDKFCACMDYHVKNDEEAAKCESETKSACAMVIAFGEGPYNGAGKKAGKPVKKEMLRVPEEIPSVGKEFMNVFEKCDTQHATISSCALNHDLCYNATTEEKPESRCLIGLLRCLDDTRQDRDPNPDCDMAIEWVLYKMVEKEEAKQIEEVGSADGSGDESGSGSGGGSGGDLNVLMVQDVLLNKTYVQKIYLQVIRQASSHSWVVYFSFFFCLFFCCTILIVGIAQCNKEEVHHHNDRIDFHLDSVASSKGSTVSEHSESESRSSRKK